MSDTVDAVRDLHAPDGTERSLRCLGCDYEGWEAEPPDWPCRTASVVYSEAEIADIWATWGSWVKWLAGAHQRQALASGWSENDDMMADLKRIAHRTLVPLHTNAKE